MCRYCDQAHRVNPRAKEHQKLEKEKRQRGECRYYACTNKKHPNWAVCNEHKCLNPNCTRGFTDGKTPYCGRKYCKPPCEVKGCTNPLINEFGKHTRCKQHQPFVCEICGKAALGAPFCDEHRCIHIASYSHERCVNGGIYTDRCCQLHTNLGCQIKGCMALRVDSSVYCSEHKCVHTLCMKPRELQKGTTYCSDHVCSHSECKNPKLEGKRLCATHLCKCGRPKFNEHSCRDKRQIKESEKLPLPPE